jgi:hypothetical protein
MQRIKFYTFNAAHEMQPQEKLLILAAFILFANLR